MHEPNMRHRAWALSAALVLLHASGSALAQSAPTALHTEVERSIRPADDFYGYANSRWLAATPAPEGLGRVDTTTLLRAENARRVRDLIEGAASATAPANTADLARKIADYHASLLDRAGIDARALDPLQDDLTAIAAIRDRTDLAIVLARTLRLDDGSNQQTESLWGLWVHQGFHDADVYAAHIVQGGLGLADLEDYLSPVADHAAHRAIYRAHIAAILSDVAGLDEAEARATRVLDLEIAIAATHASRADTDDVFKIDNSWSAADFQRQAPGFDWPAYFAASGIGPATSFVVWQPGAVRGGAALLATEALETWKDYLAFHLIQHYSSVLPTGIGEENRRFEGAMTGSAPPDFDAVQQSIIGTEAAFGGGIGRFYAQRYVQPGLQPAVAAMVETIRTAYRARLNSVSWMTPEARAVALSKLEALRIGLVSPDHWADYSDLSVVRGEAFANLARAEAFARHREIAQLGQPVDPDEWPGQLHPQMVAAILSISPNTMQFASGLFQPPYFDPDGDAASNYGSAGAGLAHEIVHTFDAVSNQYDARGRLAPWWTAQDRAGHQAVSARLAAQLDRCCPGADACARGKQILGESAADLAGLSVAYDAYLLSLEGRSDPIKDGLTGSQRFFIAYAQRWRRQQSEDGFRHQSMVDNHAPPACRADLVQNLDAWVEAFDVSPGDALYLAPADRIRIW